jgi:hypothetical protein
VGGATCCRASACRGGRRSRVHLRSWVVVVLRRCGHATSQGLDGGQQSLDGMRPSRSTCVSLWGHRSIRWVKGAAATCCPPRVPFPPCRHSSFTSEEHMPFADVSHLKKIWIVAASCHLLGRKDRRAYGSGLTEVIDTGGSTTAALVYTMEQRTM